MSALLHGEELTGVRLKDTVTGAETEVPCDAVFVSIGRKPATELVEGQLELDRSGYIVADETTRTNHPRRLRRGGRADQTPAPGGDRRADGAVAVTWRRSIWQEVPDMKEKAGKWMKPALFTLGGRPGWAGLLSGGGMPHRQLHHHLQPLHLHGLYGPGGVAAVRCVRNGA